MILTHIVACSENRVIGTQGGLPWDLPEDMKFFRDTTKGHVMIMGRKTFDSFHGKALPNRYHIVVTRDPSKHSFPSTEKSPVVFVASLEEAVEHARPLTAQWGEEVFIIGGGEIYKQAFAKNLTDKVYLTLIHREFPGDTHYPEIDEKLFTLTQRRDVELPIPFSFLTYLKK
ncbi:dihydrofolate reductase [Bdellovibrio sp. SKB1291214]|uniref:dihydrofolate reductase n=1 Tax=Bdellovibrio sp. SKB1291214 TaxID=1732569 RepID=UPI00223F35F2|nr:dihydrofolate reductase [Bdellovibrio sp. SKB1291214]UYL09988.1 dihydrofolate reductase [Bdellovibrio sp. SKB1291214]